MIKIGDKVFISKGNAGKGVWGTIQSILLLSEDKLYFCEEFDEALLREEFQTEEEIENLHLNSKYSIQ